MSEGRRSAGRERARRTACVLAIALFLPASAPALAGKVRVAMDHSRGDCRVRGTFSASVPLGVAWDVLSDYEHIDRFVRSVRSSRLEPGTDGRLLLRQEAVGGQFPFRSRVEVLLDIREDPGRRIAFRDVLGKDFRSYAGEWTVSADSLVTRVNYELAAEPSGAIARTLCRGMLRRTAQDLLEEVRAEILRRNAHGPGPDGSAGGR